VLAVASGEDGVALVRDLGADDAVDGQHGDVSHALQNFGPVDAVLVLVGGEITDRVVESVKSGGVVAWPNGVEPTPAKRHGIRMAPYDAIPGVRESITSRWRSKR
jgi:NADPH2:quinone reductase